jgi:hypothetical protein
MQLSNRGCWEPIGTFSFTLRLKDGTIGNIEYNFPEGKDCTLTNGEIQCEWNAVIPLPELKATKKRHSTVSLMRNTGELKIFLETWGYEGKGVTGTPTSSMTMIRTGVCRPVGNPIF